MVIESHACIARLPSREWEGWIWNVNLNVTNGFFWIVENYYDWGTHTKLCAIENLGNCILQRDGGM